MLERCVNFAIEIWGRDRRRCDAVASVPDAFTMHVRNSNLYSFYFQKGSTYGVKYSYFSDKLQHIVIDTHISDEVFLAMNVADSSQYIKADGRAVRNARRISKIFHLVNCRVNCHNYHTVSLVPLSDCSLFCNGTGKTIFLG